jgi:predicted nucleic acid-binding protein
LSIVLDSSVVIAWAVPDERDAAAEALLLRVIDERAWVSSLWPLEIANVLLMLERRGRLTSDERAKAMTDVATIPVSVDSETGDRAWTDTLALAERHRLTVYDACYLELALRRGLPLASRDKDLRRAAGLEGLSVLG